MKEYREIIVKLKNEFLRQEEVRSQQLQPSSSSGGGRTSGASGATMEELQLLRKQVSALRDGLSQAKEEMEKQRKSREKLSHALKASEERSDSYENEMQNAQELAATAQQSLAHCRKERDESIKKEVRMREKLKEFLSDEREKNADGGAGGVTDSISKQLNDFKEKVKQLEKNTEILRIQNMALRRANNSGTGTGPSGADLPITSQIVSSVDVPTLTDSGRPQSAPLGPSTKDGGHASSHTLGSRGDEVLNTPSSPRNDGSMRDLRMEKHAKWEEDKKLQSRNSILTKRVREMDEDNNNLRNQLKELKEKAAKDIAHRQDTLKHANSKRSTHEPEHRHVNVGEAHIMEEVCAD